MTCTSLLSALLGLGLLAAVAGCSDGDKGTGADGGAPAADASSEAATGTDGGKGESISCYTDVQFVCEENPTPSAADVANLMVVCSSNSGSFKSPAECPKPGFLGKCTLTSDGTLRVRRYYMGEGVDAAYQQDFCVNTAQGMWSTTF